MSDCEGNCLFQYSSLFGLLSGYNCRLRASIRRNFVKLNWATCEVAKMIIATVSDTALRTTGRRTMLERHLLVLLLVAKLYNMYTNVSEEQN